jgi:putative ABC transport system ATP-binding protein
LAAARHKLERLPHLELRAASKTYQTGDEILTALDCASLTCEAGTVTALLGRSGCGKSTLLNLAGAMDFPTSGDVLIDGVSTASMGDVERTRLRRHSIGFVFQFFQLLPTLTALENVELPLLLANTPRSSAIARERLSWVGLGDRGGSYPHQLSGGQMQRVAVARALAQTPAILIADEPTGNLDTTSGEQVLQFIRSAATEFGAAVLMATHSAEAAAIANFKVLMRDGRIQSIEQN